MTNNKKLILVPHCFTTKGFNPQFRNEMNEIMQVLLNSEAGIFQMPCPHLIMLMEKANYKSIEFNNGNINSDRSQELNSLYSKHLVSYLMQIDEYKKQGFEIAGLIGVSNSPVCALKNIEVESQKSQSAFMDILKEQLEERDIHTCITNIDIPLGNDKISETYINLNE